MASKLPFSPTRTRTLDHRRAATSDRVAALLLKRGSGSEFNSTRNLEDTVQSTTADGVRRSDLTESWPADIEDCVAGSVWYQTGRKNSGQKVSVIQNIECVRTDLETHPFSYPDTLRH